MKRLTGKKQAVEITGIPRSTLFHWVQSGKIEEYFIEGTMLERKSGLVCIEEIESLLHRKNT